MATTTSASAAEAGGVPAAAFAVQICDVIESAVDHGDQRIIRR